MKAEAKIFEGCLHPELIDEYIRGVKEGAKESKLQALKEEVEKLDVFGVKDGSEWHDVVRLDKIRNLITNLEDNG